MTIPLGPTDPRWLLDDDPIETTRRQIEETGRTVEHVGSDLAEGGVRQVKDQLDTAGKVGGDLLDGGKNAVEDYAGSYRDAANDALHGNVLKAGGDVLLGNLKAAGDVAESGIKATGDLVKGSVKLTEDALDTAADVGKDAVTGAKHLLFGGGDNKEGTLKAVGHLDKDKLEAAQKHEKQAKKQLSQIQDKLAGNDPSAFGSADELLKPGEVGLQFFTWFLPAYNAWTGSKTTVAQLKKLYEAEHGMRFDALLKDSRNLTAQTAKLDHVDNALQASYNQVVPKWQGTAAAQFETTMTTFFHGDQTVVDDLGRLGKGIATVAMSLEKMIYTKSNAVAGLYGEVLAPGIDPVQAAHTMVHVAQNDGCHDQQRRWVLGTFHQEMHGRHMYDDDTDTWSEDSLDDNSRRHAQEVAANWCNSVLVAQVEQRIELLKSICSRTTQGIQSLFDQLTSQVGAEQNPYAGMSASAPSDGTAPQSSGGGGGGAGGGAGGGGGYSGGGAGGGSGAGAGGGAGGGGQQVPIPNVGAPYHPPSDNAPTSPTGTLPGGTLPGGTLPGGTLPGGTLPGGTLPSNPADAPITNADGSVSFGAGHDLRLSRQNPDGSVDLTQTGAEGVQKYHIGFGPNGRPVVTVAGADGQLSTPAGVRTNADGSITLDGDLTVGTDRDGHFQLTEAGDGGAAGAGGTAGSASHAYSVSYDASGAPHVAEASAGADLGSDLDGATFTGAAGAGGDLAAGAGASVDTVPADATSAFASTDSTGSAAADGSGGPDASGGAAGDGGGDTATTDTSASAAAPGSTGTGNQLGVGNQYGSDATVADASGGATGAGTAAAAAAAGGQGGGHGSGGMMGGMPMGGMGRGGAGGGGGDDLARKYAVKPENVLDDGELEQWDRLGPTIG